MSLPKRSRSSEKRLKPPTCRRPRKTKRLRQLKKLERMHPDAAETATLRNWMEIMTDLPWSKASNDNLDLLKAERILNEDHYGLEKVKERIIEALAVRKLKEKPKGPILCLVGPPGVGKTSLGPIDRARVWIESLCACRWAACTTKLRFAAIDGLMSAQCPAASFRPFSRPGQTIR